MCVWYNHVGEKSEGKRGKRELVYCGDFTGTGSYISHRSPLSEHTRERERERKRERERRDRQANRLTEIERETESERGR